MKGCCSDPTNQLFTQNLKKQNSYDRSYMIPGGRCLISQCAFTAKQKEIKLQVIHQKWLKEKSMYYTASYITNCIATLYLSATF